MSTKTAIVLSSEVVSIKSVTVVIVSKNEVISFDNCKFCAGWDRTVAVAIIATFTEEREKNCGVVLIQT